MSEETAKPDETPSATAPASVRRGGGLALFVALVALGTAATQPLWQAHVYPQPAPPVPVVAADNSAEVAALRQELAALRQRLAEVESRPLPATANIDLAPLEARLTRLEARPLPADTTSLEQAVAELRQEVTGTTRGDDAQKTLMVAALQLVGAWQNGLPFEAPWLAALAAAGVADQSLALELNDAAPELLPWRDRGVPRLARLTADFPAAAQQVVQANAPKGETWWQQSIARVKGLVTIRRQGEAVPEGDTAVDAVLARAEVKLNTGDLPAALEQLRALDEASATVMAEWLGAARARVKVDALSAELAQRAAGGLLGDGRAVQEMLPETVPELVPEVAPEVAP